jgi:hypothetical protein
MNTKHANPAPARMDTDAKSYSDEAQYHVDNAVFEINLYRGQFGDSINLENAIKFLKIALSRHNYSQHLAGNTLEEFVKEVKVQ